jgi:hypothetical protein
MRSAAPGDRPAAVDAWHAATDRLRPCLEAADSC